MKRFFLFMVLSAVCFSTNAQDTWLTKAVFPGGARLGTVSFSIGTKGYIGTGYGNPSHIYFNDLWEWDQSTDTWTQKADLPAAPRGWSVGFAIAGKGYIATGNNPDSVFHYQDLWEWDQATNLWSQKSSLPYALSSAVAFVIGNKAYVGTGVRSGVLLTNWMWEYNPITDMWTPKNDFGGTPRSSAVAFSIGNKGYIGTGNDGTKRKDFWEYNPTMDLWTQKNDFSGTARNSAVAFSIDSNGYIGTGNDIYNFIKRDLWKYEKATDLWTQCANMNLSTGRWVATGFSVGTRGYIGLGFNSGSLNDLHEYTPGPVGIENYSQENTISIFPNPVHETATLVIGESTNPIQISIHDLQGKIIFSKEMTMNPSAPFIQIDVSEWSNGVYLVNMTSGKTVATKRLVITH